MSDIDLTTRSMRITTVVVAGVLLLALFADLERRQRTFCRFNPDDAVCARTDIPPAAFDQYP